MAPPLKPEMVVPLGSLLECIPSSPGLYIAILAVEGRICKRVGGLGHRCVDPGLYGYVGSARGPGGLRSRIARHAAKEKRVRWHIDYITSDPNTALKIVVYVETRSSLEGELARAFESLECWEPYIEGFGSSDNNSRTHLFRCGCYLGECLGEALRAIEERLGLPPRVCGGSLQSLA